MDAKRRVDAQVLALTTAHLPGVLETLERRRAAGTLLPGCCRAHEVAWRADRLRTDAIFDGEPQQDEVSILQAAQHVGVEEYFTAASAAVLALQKGLQRGVLPDEPLLGRCLNFVEHALLLTLRAQPYDGEPHVVGIPTAETFLLRIFRTVLLPDLKPEEPRYARLLAAWHNVKQSGLWQKLQVEQTRERIERHAKSVADVQAAKSTGVPLRTCALPSCGAREAHVTHFKRCGACGQVFYCSKQHQTEHWPTHKAACKAARKATSQATGEGGASQDA